MRLISKFHVLGNVIYFSKCVIFFYDTVTTARNKLRYQGLAGNVSTVLKEIRFMISDLMKFVIEDRIFIYRTGLDLFQAGW